VLLGGGAAGASLRIDMHKDWQRYLLFPTPTAPSQRSLVTDECRSGVGDGNETRWREREGEIVMRCAVHTFLVLCHGSTRSGLGLEAGSAHSRAVAHLVNQHPFDPTPSCSCPSFFLLRGHTHLFSLSLTLSHPLSLSLTYARHPIDGRFHSAGRPELHGSVTVTY
jgi:hypothetical protein